MWVGLAALQHPCSLPQALMCAFVLLWGKWALYSPLTHPLSLAHLLSFCVNYYNRNQMYVNHVLERKKFSLIFFEKASMICVVFFSLPPHHFELVVVKCEC